MLTTTRCVSAVIVVGLVLFWASLVCSRPSQTTKTIITTTTFDSHKIFPWGRPFALSPLAWRGGETGTTITEQAETAVFYYPEWFTPMDHDTLQPFLELARQRHDEAVQKARESYYHIDPSSSNQNTDDEILVDEDILSSLSFDELSIQSTQRLPDFHEELNSTIYVTKTPLFTKEECRAVIDWAEEHFAGQQEQWTRMASGQYQVAGFWIRSVPTVHAWFNRMVQRRLFPLLARRFPNFITSPNDLVVDNAYLFKYTPETGRRTDVHTDSGCLSFTIALNQREQEYQGGGTWFEGLTRSGTLSPDHIINSSSVLEMDAGQVTIRPGGVRHCGHAVTEGVRYIIGGFCMRVDKVEPVRQLVGLASELLQQDPTIVSHVKEHVILDKAGQVLHAALTLNPYFDGVYTHLARLYQTRGQPTKARQVLEHCHTHVNAKSGEVAYSLGLLCLDQGDYDQVLSCMRACLDADVNDVDAMALMAQAISHRRAQHSSSISASSQNEDEEERWYRRIAQNPNSTPQQLASAYCNLGVLHEGREDEVELYQKSLEYDSNNFATWYSLASALASQRQYETAASAFRQAIFRTNDHADTENRSKALHSLYRLAVAHLQEDPPNRFSSQQEMLQELQRIMGEDNYALLAAERR